MTHSIYICTFLIIILFLFLFIFKKGGVLREKSPQRLKDALALHQPLSPLPPPTVELSRTFINSFRDSSIQDTQWGGKKKI